MTSSETRQHATAGGSVRSIIYYQDDSGAPCDKAAATRAEIVEYDADDKEIQRTYGTINRTTGDGPA